jgi:hypothetical protein
MDDSTSEDNDGADVAANARLLKQVVTDQPCALFMLPHNIFAHNIRV